MKFFAKLARHWYLYMIPVILFPLAVGYFYHGKLALYQSSAYLVVSQPAYLAGLKLNGSDPYLSPATNAANAINELLASRSFTIKVGDNTDLSNIYDAATSAGQDALVSRVQSAVTVYASATGPNALYVAASDPSAHIAQQLVTSVITLYTQYDTASAVLREQQAQAFYTQQLTQAKQKLETDAAKVQAYVQAHPEVAHAVAQNNPVVDSQYLQLQQAYTQDSANVQQFNTTLDQVNLDQAAVSAGQNQDIQVLDQPLLSHAPTYSKKKLLTYMGEGLAIALALVGLIVGGLMVIDRKVYNKDDVKSLLDDLELEVPLIETFPTVDAKAGRAGANGETSGTMSRLLLPVLALPPASAVLASGHLSEPAGDARENEK